MYNRPHTRLYQTYSTDISDLVFSIPELLPDMLDLTCSIPDHRLDKPGLIFIMPDLRQIKPDLIYCYRSETRYVRPFIRQPDLRPDRLHLLYSIPPDLTKNFFNNLKLFSSVKMKKISLFFYLKTR